MVLTFAAWSIWDKAWAFVSKIMKTSLLTMARCSIRDRSIDMQTLGGGREGIGIVDTARLPKEGSAIVGIFLSYFREASVGFV